MTATVSAMAIVIVLFSIDLAIPMMYSIFRVDRGRSFGELRSIRSKYKVVSFPRSALLAAFILSIIFAPTGAENNPIYLSVFIALAVAYILCAIIDIRRAYAEVK